MKKLSVTEVQKRLKDIPEEFHSVAENESIAITRRGKPVMALIPWSLYESITETLGILGDKDLMAALKQAQAEEERGEKIPWEDAKRELGL